LALKKSTKSSSKQSRPRKPEVVLREGKPAAVILDIEEYREMLEELEQVEDLKALKALKALRRRPLRFRRLEDFLEERASRV
jgi:PHD/YefM family antitoxin component YafN of YafNO toxin-antitoxin module